jgi:hypothetical protein
VTYPEENDGTVQSEPRKPVDWKADREYVEATRQHDDHKAAAYHHPACQRCFDENNRAAVPAKRNWSSLVTHNADGQQLFWCASCGRYQPDPHAAVMGAKPHPDPWRQDAIDADTLNAMQAKIERTQPEPGSTSDGRIVYQPSGEKLEWCDFHQAWFQAGSICVAGARHHFVKMGGGIHEYQEDPEVQAQLDAIVDDDRPTDKAKAEELIDSQELAELRRDRALLIALLIDDARSRLGVTNASS